jgi:hypothetical protein
MNTPQIIAALTRAFHQPAIVANPCELITACSVCGRTLNLCNCIGTYAFPRPSERHEQHTGQEVCEGLKHQIHNGGINS